MKITEAWEFGGCFESAIIGKSEEWDGGGW